MQRFAVHSVLALALIFSPMPGGATTRLALVIGIDSYDHLPDLANATRDARAVSDQLSSLGFETLLHLNVTNRQIYRALRDFENRLASEATTGLVFFAGHGIQSDGRNYLIPADALIEVEDDLEPESIDAGRILEALARAGNSLNILVLDACRDNPLPNRTRSATRGLSVTNIPSGARGTAILYAAGEGQVAQDGPPGGHGIFTESLLTALRKPNLTLEQVIKEVTRGVLQRTNGRQRPWSLASIQGDFYFNKQEVIVDAIAPQAPEPGSTLSRNEIARDVWQAIKDSDNRQLIENFSERFGDTPYAMAAQAQLAMLTPTPSPSQAPQTKQPAKEAIEKADEVKVFGPHEMVKIETRCWKMGSSPKERGHQVDEKQTTVCFKDYLIDRYEVTFDAYDTFARETGRELPDDDGMGRGRRPVINVDWDDAWAYAAWASQKYGARFRLPTEAEWEYACKGRNVRAPYCGSYVANEVATFNAPTTQPVGSKKPNEFGLYDMSGNAWEMTCSPYDRTASSGMGGVGYAGGQTKCLKESPRGQETLVFRGGGWESPSEDVRGARRRTNYYGAPQHIYTEPFVSELGFRLAADAQ